MELSKSVHRATHRSSESALRNAGHQASTAADENLRGKADTDVAAAAKSEGMMIFTLHVAFADLRRCHITPSFYAEHEHPYQNLIDLPIIA